MRKWIHYDIPSIERIDGLPEGRRYKVPDTAELYPSVSTVIGAAADLSYLEEWRNKIGREAADKITKESARRGTAIHLGCENYLQGLPVKFSHYDHVAKGMFDQLLPVLDGIEEIHAMETQLFSHRLKVAGTVDLIGKYKGRLRVIDWKNSRRVKYREDIPGYFMQAAAYSAMFYELTGIVVKDILIAMTVEDYGLLLFEEKVSDYLKDFIDIRRKFML